MLSFQYNSLPSRVIFGSGTIARLGDELRRQNLTRVLFLSAPGQADLVRELAETVGSLCAGIFTGATMHTPVSVTLEALEALRDIQADGIVAIGGGSTTGLAKAIAWRTDLPQVVVPTTFAGSEMTPILGETSEGRKITFSDPKVLPEVVIYDVELAKTLPVAVAVASGMNAMAHAVEALYAADANPVTSLMALEAIGAFNIALPRLLETSRSLEARERALYGAWLCGICLASVSMSLHHKLCHVLGGLFDLPHAEMHSILLPHVAAFNMPAVPEVNSKLQDTLGSPDPGQALYDLGRRLGIKPGLADIGMPEHGIATTVDAVLANPCRNPRPFDRRCLTALLERAYAGLQPAI